MNLEFVPLEGRYVRLEPLVAANKEELRAALDCDPESWEIMSVNGCGEGFEDWWGAMRGESQRKTRNAYAIRRLSDGKLVGTTSFLNIRTIHAGVEVGATFIAPDARSGPVNPESKKLLLGQAFDAGAVRVEFMIDTRNVRSQAAVEKLGAEKEGVMRKHKITWTGYVRDTAVFSITNDDWPAVEARLDYRLQEDFV